MFRIVGRREFWGLSLRGHPGTCSTRAPTPRRSSRPSGAAGPIGGRRRCGLLDLGTGSGALLCALLAVFPNATGVGVDRSAAACAVARDNLAACGFAARGAIVEGDWTAPVPRAVRHRGLQPALHSRRRDFGPRPRGCADHDPLVALDGGSDGLGCLPGFEPRRRGPALRPRSLVAFEVGWDQAGAVAAMLRDAGFTTTSAWSATSAATSASCWPHCRARGPRAKSAPSSCGVLR